MSNRLAGVAFVTIDGKSYSIAGEGTYKPDGETREALLGQDGYHGHKSMPSAGMIKWKGRDSAGIAVQAISASSNSTVTLELANGKVVIGRNMVRTGEALEVSTEDGTFEVTFEGPSVTEN